MNSNCWGFGVLGFWGFGVLGWARVLHLLGELLLELNVILVANLPFNALLFELLIHTRLYDLALFTVDLVHTLLIDFTKGLGVSTFGTHLTHVDGTHQLGDLLRAEALATAAGRRVRPVAATLMHASAAHRPPLAHGPRHLLTDRQRGVVV